MVRVIDVPVETGKNLGVALVRREISERAGVVAVLVLHMGGNFLHVGN